jgi:hypothetical protein
VAPEEQNQDKQVDMSRANTHPRFKMGIPRQPNGPNAIDMLTSPVQDGRHQDDPELTEEFWNATSGLIGPDDPLEIDPDQEGPPGAARDGLGPGD